MMFYFILMFLLPSNPIQTLYFVIFCNKNKGCKNFVFKSVIGAMNNLCTH